MVEEEPSSAILQDLELESADDLLGLYQGVPIDQASFFQPAGELPARIAIYLEAPFFVSAGRRSKSFTRSVTLSSMNLDTMSAWMTTRCRTEI